MNTLISGDYQMVCIDSISDLLIYFIFNIDFNQNQAHIRQWKLFEQIV